MTIKRSLPYENLRLNEHFLQELKETQQLIKERELSFTEKYTEGEYTIIVDHYSHKHPEERYWDILQVNIFDKILHRICSFTRNYYSIDFCLVSQNGTDFLITSEDYQALTIINLTTGVISTYGDWEAIQNGIGWCPLYIDFDDDEIILEGCYWGGPSEYYYIPAANLNNPDFMAAVLSIEDSICEEDENDSNE